jgi:hypothetical protein
MAIAKSFLFIPHPSSTSLPITCLLYFLKLFIAQALKEHLSLIGTIN